MFNNLLNFWNKDLCQLLLKFKVISKLIEEVFTKAHQVVVADWTMVFYWLDRKTTITLWRIVGALVGENKDTLEWRLVKEEELVELPTNGMLFQLLEVIIYEYNL